MVERAAQLDGRLPDPDTDLGHLEFGEDLVADRLSDGFEQAVRGGLHDLPGDGVHATVIDGLLEIVLDAGWLQVQHQFHVDLERLRRGELVLVVAMSTAEAHVAQDDAVAHRTLRSE